MPASLDQQWSPEEDATIHSLVRRGIQIKDMPPYLLKRTLRGIQCRIYALGLKSGQPRTKHSKNESFWEIPNALNSYYAGLLAADGNVCSHKHILQWVCHESDRNALEGFVAATGFTGGIRSHTRQKPLGGDTVHTSVRVAACQKWNADLARVFNVIPQKAHRLAPPPLPTDYLFCCYLIGYTDGDGCISIGRPKDGPEMPVICYTSASRAILEGLQTFVESRFPFSRSGKQPQIATSSNGQYHHYRIYGMVAIKIVEFLRQLPVPRFARKWDNPDLLAIIETYRAKWPDYFAPANQLWFDEAGVLRRGLPVALATIPALPV